MKLSEIEFKDLSDDFLGYCMLRDEVTTEGVEPDADHYKCDECGRNSVMGLENALISGHIFVSD